MHWRRKWATHSSVLAWRIPGTAEPGGLLSMGLHRVQRDWSDLAAAAAASDFHFHYLKNHDISPCLHPASRPSALQCAGGFCFCLWVVVSLCWRVFWCVFSLDSGNLLGMVACFVVTFFSYAWLGSQNQLGKVSWGNQKLLLSLWNSEIRTTLQHNWIINVVCRLVTQSIGQ